MQKVIALLAPAAVAGLLAWLLTPVSVWLARRVGAIDQPGPRRVHSRPIPRLGGLAVIAAAVVVLAAGLVGIPGAPRWGDPTTAAGILVGLIPIAAVSMRDDVSQVRALSKFAAHAIGAVVAMSCGVLLPGTVHFFGYVAPLGWVAVPLSFLWLTGVTNAFNLVDGLDGLSAGLGFISAASLAGVLLLSRDPLLAPVVLVLAGSILGFLPYNLHPARVFLGDTGATAIGYLLACFTLVSSARLSAGFATLIPVLLLAVPIADTVVSMLRRFVGRLENGDGVRIYEADRDHIHHRLLVLGLSHRKAVWILYAAGSALSLVALTSMLVTGQRAAYLLFGVVLAGFVGLNRLGYGEFAFLRRGVGLRFYNLPVLRWSFFVVFVDLLILAVALYLAVVLKYGDWRLERFRGLLLSVFVTLTPLTVIAFWLSGMYRGSWRLAGIDDFRHLSTAVLGASVGGVVLFGLTVSSHVPLSLFAIFALAELILANGSRISYRLLNQIRMRARNEGERTLIYGAGESGAANAHEMLSDTSLGLLPVGFIDDDPYRAGRAVIGYPILGNLEQIETAIERTAATVVVLSSKKIPEDKVAKVRSLCRARGVRLVRMRMGFEEITDPAGPDVTDPRQASQTDGFGDRRQS